MAHLLIIDLPGGNDTDIIEAAHADGHEFTFLTSDLSLYEAQPSVHAPIIGAVERMEVKGFPYKAVESAVLGLHRRRAVDAVLCLIDIRLTEAARLARCLDLPFVNPATAFLLRDKVNVRQRLAERGIAQPRFELALSNDELERSVSRLGYPALVKPADGYGSQNVVLLRDSADLAPWTCANGGMLPSHADYGLGVRANDRLLVEEYMSGVLIGCDTLTVAGRHSLVGVNEKSMFAPPSFAIRGSTFTPIGLATELDVESIEAYARAVLDAVCFDCGAAHIEIMLTAQGPRLVEINGRLVGAKMPRLMDIATGRSTYRDLIRLHLGESLATAQAQCPAGFSASRWVVAAGAGTLSSIEWPEWDDARICHREVVKSQGAFVHPPFENSDRLACVMTRGVSRLEAEGLAERYVGDTTVSMT